MEPSDGIERCGVHTKRGGTCGKPAGWGTPYHTGPCKLHGGTLPSVARKQAQREALSFARGQLGQELDIDPLEGVLLAVRLSHGIVDYWRHKLATAPTSDPDTRDGYQKAVMEYTRICEIAIKAGVAERQIKIVERMSERFSLLFEDLMRAGQVTPQQRTVMLDVWVNGIAALEQPVIDATGEDLAA